MVNYEFLEAAVEPFDFRLFRDTLDKSEEQYAHNE